MKCYSLKTFILLAPALAFFELMQFTWLATRGNARVWAQAYKAYAQRRPQLREARAITQRGRKVRDGEILREVKLPMTGHTRAGFAGHLLAHCADILLRGYWRLIRRGV